MEKLDENTKLTPEQIENWRRVLGGMFGPYAYVASDDQIQQMRDNMQAQCKLKQMTEEIQC